MAQWISSKLKVAENLLQQIDQQAAESLKKGEKSRSDDELRVDVPKTSGSSVSLKDQLKKKAPEKSDYYGKLSSDIDQIATSNPVREVVEPPKSTVTPKPTLTDGDWTELLSTPSKPAPSTSTRSNGVPAINALRGMRRDGRKMGSPIHRMSLAVAEGNRKSKSGAAVSKSERKLSNLEGSKSNGKSSNGEDSGLSGSVAKSTGVDLADNGKLSEEKGLDSMQESKNSAVKGKDETLARQTDSEEVRAKEAIEVTDKSSPQEMVVSQGKVDEVPPMKKTLSVGDRLRNVVKGKHKSTAASSSDEESESDSASGSTSDSESEGEREERRRRREKILAEKAAAKAVEAIKEHENVVARLEGEKQSLEKILEERAKQQAKEASELQTTMMEVMEAAEVEKQKHNNTRMEALSRLAKLEMTNAELAKSLAAAQWNFEVEVNRVGELRQKIEVKEMGLEEFRRKISNNRPAESFRNRLTASKGVEFEWEILEAEYSFIGDKIGQLQDKARKMEESIELTRKAIEEPTEVEIELKRRLDQLTDHLIQKQAQVEALSSEKATLQFRIEAVSRLLEETKTIINSSSSLAGDIESGTWEFSNSKLKPLLEDGIISGRQHLGSILRQLDSIFVAGAVLLKRNSKAKLWAMVYLICLHLWVIYIFISHSQTSDEIKSGAVFSLENINKTAGG